MKSFKIVTSKSYFWLTIWIDMLVIASISVTIQAGTRVAIVGYTVIAQHRGRQGILAKLEPHQSVVEGSIMSS